VRRRLFSFLLLVLALLSCLGCQQEEQTPQGAALRFVRAANEGEAGDVFKMLDPAVQELLTKMSRLANAQSGGSQRYKPEDLLAVGQVPVALELTEVKVVKIEHGNRATVELVGSEKMRQLLELVKIDKVWHIRLPAEWLKNPSYTTTH